MDFKKEIDGVQKDTSIMLLPGIIGELEELEYAMVALNNSNASTEVKIERAKRYARDTFGSIYLSIEKLDEDRVKKLGDTLSAKNSDYGNSFDRGIDLYGVPGMALRISDKLHRMRTLTKNMSTPRVDESLSDTAVDALGYLVLIFTYSPTGTR